MILSYHSFTLIDLTFPYSASGWNMSYYLWGVFRVRREDPNLPYHVPTRKHSNFNGNLLAVGRRTHAHASSGASFYYSATCEDSPSVMPLEANHEGCPNGENSLGEPVCGGPLEDQHHDSVTASLSTNNNSAINEFVTTPTRIKQVSLSVEDL